MGFSQHHFMVTASGVVSSVSKLVAKKYIQTFSQNCFSLFYRLQAVHLFDLLPLFLGFFFFWEAYSLVGVGFPDVSAGVSGTMGFVY